MEGVIELVASRRRHASGAVARHYPPSRAPGPSSRRVMALVSTRLCDVHMMLLGVLLVLLVLVFVWFYGEEKEKELGRGGSGDDDDDDDDDGDDDGDD
eukprot:140036-Rhodomonas_salina.1